MLVVEGLVKRFGARTVLDGLRLTVAAGEYVAIVGESGSGKSTLLNLIAGLDQPDSGSVAVDGANLSAMSDDQRTLTRRAKVGFVFQSFHILPHLTVAQNVELPLVLLGVTREARAQRVAELLAAVGLGDRGASMPRELSGGELQRIALARALVHQPALVLADEPTGNLDPDTAHTVLTLLAGEIRSRGAGGVLVTHSEAAAHWRTASWCLTTAACGRAREDALVSVARDRRLCPTASVAHARADHRDRPRRGARLCSALDQHVRAERILFRGALRPPARPTPRSSGSPAGFDEACWNACSRIRRSSSRARDVAISAAVLDPALRRALLTITGHRCTSRIDAVVESAAESPARPDPASRCSTMVCFFRPRRWRNGSLAWATHCGCRSPSRRSTEDRWPAARRESAGQLIGVMDLGFAQWRLDRLGTLTRIDLQLRLVRRRCQWRSRWRCRPALRCRARTKPTRVSNLSRAYRINLNVLALVALFTGAFLVFSLQAQATDGAPLAARFPSRPGVTARAVERLLLAEAPLFGASRRPFGLLLGAALATASLQLLGGDLGSGFFGGTRPQVEFSHHSIRSVFCARVGSRRSPAAGCRRATPLAHRLPTR